MKRAAPLALVPIFVILLLWSAACASQVKRVRSAFRDAGERNTALPEKVWKEYRCAKRRTPYLKIESVEVVPERLHAGSEFNHRWVYALCSGSATSVVTGKLQTNILFRGAAIVSDSDPSFELKPGRWVIDTFVEVPPAAVPGIYSLEIRFVDKALRFERRRSFVVERD